MATILDFTMSLVLDLVLSLLDSVLPWQSCLVHNTGICEAKYVYMPYLMHNETNTQKNIMFKCTYRMPVTPTISTIYIFDTSMLILCQCVGHQAISKTNTGSQLKHSSQPIIWVNAYIITNTKSSYASKYRTPTLLALTMSNFQHDDGVKLQTYK